MYDDTGANDPMTFQSPHGTGLNRATGDVDHRDHGAALNSADLLTLRTALSGRTLRVRFELNTLFPTDRTLAALAVDVDDNASTGGGGWGIGNIRSRGWDQRAVFSRRDAAANTIEGELTLSRAPASRIRIQAILALGDGTPMNVAFRGDESGSWWDEKQAAALATGDVSAFGVRVATTDFGRAHRPAPPPGPGYYDRVYTSRYPIDEGVDYAGRQGDTTATFHYLGRYQPYAVFVPHRRAPHGVQLTLHGASAAHASVVGQPGMQTQFGTNPNRILVSPLGRGPNNSYVDWGARDALDALADVEAHYATDRDRVFVSGYSMGGGGTLFLSSLFPDRFAGAVDWVGFSGDCLNGTFAAQGRARPPGGADLFSNDASKRDGCPLGTRGNFIDYIDNTRHVPTAHLYAGADELVWASHALGMMQKVQQLGYEQPVWVHAAEHLTFAILDDWRKEAAFSANRTRVRQPSRVTYRTNSFLAMPMVDLAPDGAYWIDDIRPRNVSATPAGDAVVDLTSRACSNVTEKQVTFGAAAGIDPLPWFGISPIVTRPAPQPSRNAIWGSLTNVRDVTLDLAAACVSRGAHVSLAITVDGPTTVRFTDGRSPVHLQ